MSITLGKDARSLYDNTRMVRVLQWGLSMVIFCYNGYYQTFPSVEAAKRQADLRGYQVGQGGKELWTLDDGEGWIVKIRFDEDKETEHGCPVCGNREKDLLVWTDDDTLNLNCLVCGKEYSVN